MMSLKMTLSFTVVITLWLELRHEHKKDKQVGVLYGSLVMAYLPKIVMSCMQFYKQIRRYNPQNDGVASCSSKTFQELGNCMLTSSQKDK